MGSLFGKAVCDDCHTALLGSAETKDAGSSQRAAEARASEARSSSSWLQAVVFPTPKEPAMIVTGIGPGESSGAMALETTRLSGKFRGINPSRMLCLLIIMSLFLCAPCKLDPRCQELRYMLPVT